MQIAPIRVPQGKVSYGAPVTLHVYDAVILPTAHTFFPLVHLGVELYGNEFSFGENGVRSLKPGMYDFERHRETHLLGYTRLRRREVYSMLMTLKKDWPGSRYRLVGCNCQTFALALLDRLGLRRDCCPERFVIFARPWKITARMDLNDLIPNRIVEQMGSSSKLEGLIQVGDFELEHGRWGEDGSDDDGGGGTPRCMTIACL